MQRAVAALPPTLRWWMWGVWGDLPAPNVYYGYDAAVLERALHILDAYAGELERNDYRPFLSGRAAANAVMGSERVFGFGSPAASTHPYADLVTEVRLVDGRFMASEPHHLDQGPEPAASYQVDLTPWLDSPTVHELVGHIREVREETGTVTAVATLTPRLVEDFRRDGFVVVPDLLSADELVRFGAAVDEGVARRSRHDTRTLAEKSLYEQSFTQCQNLWEDCPEVRPLTFHPAIAETAARLLGVEAIRIWHDQALYKEAGGRETDPHQDHPYWPIVETDTITAWIPFDGSTLETGAMGYLPGSHRLGVRAFVDIFSGHGEDPLTRDELRGDRAGVRRGPGRVGRLPPRPDVPLGRAEPDRYRPPGAHRDLFRRRIHAGRGVLPASRGGAGGHRHGRRHRQRRHAPGLAAPGRGAARSARGADGLMSVLTAAQQSSWTERGFFRIGGFAPAETCTAMLERVTDVVRDPGLAEELGVKVLPESNKAGHGGGPSRGRRVQDLPLAPRPGLRPLRPFGRRRRPAWRS